MRLRPGSVPDPVGKLTVLPRPRSWIFFRRGGQERSGKEKGEGMKGEEVEMEGKRGFQ